MNNRHFDVSEDHRTFSARAQALRAKISDESQLFSPNDQQSINKFIADAKALCDKGGGEHQGELALVNAVHTVVNEKIKYQRDSFLGIETDDWKTGAQTARDGTGDCEDFAILKAQMLIRMGVSPEKLSIMCLSPQTSMKESKNNVYHAVCIYTDNNGERWVLNNTGESKDRIVNMTPLKQYLKSDMAEGKDRLPIGEVDMATLKYKPNSLTRDGKLDVEKVIFISTSTLPDISVLEKAPEFMTAICQMIEKNTGNNRSSEQYAELLHSNPAEFIAMLREAVKDRGNISNEVAPTPSDRMKFQSVVESYILQFDERSKKLSAAASLSKNGTPVQSSPEQLPSQTNSGPVTTEPKPRSVAPGELLTQGTGSLAAKALVHVGAGEIIVRQVAETGVIGNPLLAQDVAVSTIPNETPAVQVGNNYSVRVAEYNGPSPMAMG